MISEKVASTSHPRLPHAPLLYILADSGIVSMIVASEHYQ